MQSNSIKGYLESDLVIGPETKRFRSTKIEGLDEMVEEGYKEAIDLMPQIRAIFKKREPLFKKKVQKSKDIIYID